MKNINEINLDSKYNIENENFSGEINLNEDLPSTTNNKNKKLRVNLNNIERNRKFQNYNKNEIKFSDKIEKTQIIVISRKRQRDIISDKIDEDDNFKFKNIVDKFNEKSEIINPLKKIRVDESILSEKEVEKTLSLKLDRLDLSLDREDKSDNIIKYRNLRIFSENEKCNICNNDDNNKEKLNTTFKNFYPTKLTENYEEEIKDNLILKSASQFSECRQLKFAEKRNLIDHTILKNEIEGEIKNFYTKLYGECKIIKNSKDKTVIVNEKHLTQEEIKQMINSQYSNDGKISFYSFEIDKIIASTEERILREVSLYEEKNNLVDDDQMSQDSVNNPEDSDSNRESRSENDYPDEENSNEELEDEDDYEIYNTNTKSYKPDYIKKAEQKLSKGFLDYEEDKLFGNNK